MDATRPADDGEAFGIRVPEAITPAHLIMSAAIRPLPVDRNPLLFPVAKPRLELARVWVPAALHQTRPLQATETSQEPRESGLWGLIIIPNVRSGHPLRLAAWNPDEQTPIAREVVHLDPAAKDRILEHGHLRLLVEVNPPLGIRILGEHPWKCRFDL